MTPDTFQLNSFFSYWFSFGDYLPVVMSFVLVVVIFFGWFLHLTKTGD